jgi:hypothetical protein
MIEDLSSHETQGPLRDFTDVNGQVWHATVHEEHGADYKGRFYLVLSPRDHERHGEVALEDVRWNSKSTARRTLDTMSGVELRRRLRSALGRRRAPRG